MQTHVSQDTGTLLVFTGSPSKNQLQTRLGAKPPSGRTKARRSLPPRSHWVPADADTPLGADGPRQNRTLQRLLRHGSQSHGPSISARPPNALREGSGLGPRGRRLGLEAAVGEPPGPLPPEPILLTVPRPRSPDQDPARPHARRTGSAASAVRSGKTEARGWSRGLRGSGQGTRSERTTGKRWTGEASVPSSFTSNMFAKLMTHWS